MPRQRLPRVSLKIQAHRRRRRCRLLLSPSFLQRQKLGQSGTTSSMRNLVAEAFVCFARTEAPNLNLCDTPTRPNDGRVQLAYWFIGGEGNQNGSPLTKETVGQLE